ncbi:spore gernimation protein GerD [Anaerobacillus sp. CMMVII]|uniref:spore germination lipoprotein GerD n=1 Tax=Anaerobacillus sp. CMMVII TaxID=2755588 RepID=UPI0021B833E9|nr:spore germination lipoprotein GerD [Anaerobacillus sp. CMMVII]MCT8136486.1 spore gernimation protein GerD [Anaerobacillus sp. CMMVII]
MKNLKKLLLLFTVILIAGCAAVEDQGSQPDYESTKKMMVDMLKTDEGKKSIQEVLSDDEVKQEIVLEQALVKETIQQVLTSEKGKEFWQELMQEPEFAKAFAESLQTEVEKVLKNLMKDPEYQGMMMDILQDPEMEKASLDLMKSKEYRQQVTNIMAEAFESPYFKAQVNDILGKVASEQMKKEAKETEGEKQGEEGQN